MAKQTISLGTEPKGETGDTSRVAFIKCIANFDELYLRQQGALNKSIAGAAGVVPLTADEVMSGFIFLSGIITGNKEVTVADGTRMMWNVVNGTTGPFTVKFRTASGAGVFVPADGSMLLFSNGVSIVDAAASSAAAAVAAVLAADVGKVSFVPMTTPPTGHLECNGAAISRATYATLFAKIGTTWGAGDGSSTFNIPDLRGEFIRGWDHGKGIDAGRSFATLQGDLVKSHYHVVRISPDTTGQPVRSSTGGTVQNNSSIVRAMGDDVSQVFPLYAAAEGSNMGSENRPRNVAMLPVIRYAA